MNRLRNSRIWIGFTTWPPGEGLICNNVLHKRAAFEDPPQAEAGRLVYRARFLERVGAATGDAQ